MKALTPFAYMTAYPMRVGLEEIELSTAVAEKKAEKAPYLVANRDGDRMNGWMLPNGIIKPNQYAEHEYSCQKMGYSCSREAEGAGLIRLQWGDFITMNRVSQTQYNAIYKWYLAMGYPDAEHRIKGFELE